jgi:hypothetical protein
MCLSDINVNLFDYINKNIKPINTPGIQIRNGVDPFIEFKKIFDDSDIKIGNFESNINTQNLEVVMDLIFKDRFAKYKHLY